MKTFDDQELASCNGQDGRPVYVAHRGKVVDLTGSRLWKGGVHMKRHHAGADLSTDMQAAPHGPEVLERFPQVGVLEKPEAPDRKLPPLLVRLLKRYPMFRRHPHPMTVHFPIVFMLFTPVFTLLYLVTGVKAFETTALHCLGAGVLFCGVAILTGLYTWWLNYMAQPLRAVRIKRPLSLIMLATAIVAFCWRLAVPEILDTLPGWGLIYLVLVLALVPMVMVIGWFGAEMTFPIEKE